MKQRSTSSLRSDMDSTPHAYAAKIITMVSSAKKAESFEDLVLPQLASLYNHARWLVRDDAEAEDLVQETLIKALRAFESFHAGTNFRAWIFRIQKNTFLTSRTAIAYMRTDFLEDQAQAEELADSGLSPEAHMMRLDHAALLQTALAELALPLREVVLLCDVEEFKYKEISEILGVPIGTVMSRLSRARQSLRNLLEPHLGGTL
jgi:RNA polymerase sigma factor (sigma-70 family)